LVAECNNRFSLLDGADVFVTKCNMTVKGCSVADLFATYWNTQGTWDFASTSAVQILEDRGNSQIVRHC
jgi:hypothetical protein